MKMITIAGNIGKAAVVRQTQGGDSVAGFTVAVNGFKKEDPPTWFDVSLWGKRGEKLAPFLTKGTRIAVAGEFGTREHEGRTYLTVRANEVTLQGGGDQGGSSGGSSGGHNSEIDRNIHGDMDDEIFF